MPVNLTAVSFAYPSQERPIFDSLTLALEKGWIGIVGAEGSGKTTLLNLIAGKLIPTSGVVKSLGKVVYCGLSVDVPPLGLSRLLAHQDGPSAELFGRLALAEDWLERWPTLSDGERKRAQIACALLEQPDVLQLDEPTNHVDIATRDYLVGALSRYRGIGLLVSHDRDLLDRLCRACILFEHGTVTLRPGNYTQAREQANRELETRQRQKGNAERQHAALRAEAVKRRDLASGANEKRSKRNLDKHDSDGRFRLNLARRSGKDGQAGKLLKQLEGRLHQAESRAAELFAPKRPKLGPELTGEPAAQPLLVRLEAQELPIGDRRLHIPALEIRSHDRIGVCGPDGTGKSTLVRQLLPLLDLPAGSVVYIPQEIEVASLAQIIQQIRALPPDQLSSLTSAIASLASDPERLLRTGNPSPGEMRKLMLAKGLTLRPNLIVMDEPTNHLDLPSIEALEASLLECRCALLLVSHDLPLLRKVCAIRWQIAGDPAAPSLTISEWTPAQPTPPQASGTPAA